MLSWYIGSLGDQLKLEPLIPDQSGFPWKINNISCISF